MQGLQEDIGKEENAVQAGLVSQVETTEAQVGQFLSQQDAEEIAARMDARFERLQLLCQGTDLRMMEAVAKVALAARMLPDARVTLYSTTYHTLFKVFAKIRFEINFSYIFWG